MSLKEWRVKTCAHATALAFIQAHHYAKSGSNYWLARKPTKTPTATPTTPTVATVHTL